MKFAPGGGLNSGKPALLFEDKKVSSGYTVAPDGRLVAVRQADVPGTENQINVSAALVRGPEKKIAKIGARTVDGATLP